MRLTVLRAKQVFFCLGVRCGGGASYIFSDALVRVVQAGRAPASVSTHGTAAVAISRFILPGVMLPVRLRYPRADDGPTQHRRRSLILALRAGVLLQKASLTCNSGNMSTTRSLHRSPLHLRARISIADRYRLQGCWATFAAGFLYREMIPLISAVTGNSDDSFEQIRNARAPPGAGVTR